MYAVTLSAVLLCGLQAVQDSKVPWLTDSVGTREIAQRQGKPCVVLFGIDRSVL
jgi:hypothetical protein